MELKGMKIITAANVPFSNGLGERHKAKLKQMTDKTMESHKHKMGSGELWQCAAMPHVMGIKRVFTVLTNILNES